MVLISLLVINEETKCPFTPWPSQTPIILTPHGRSNFMTGWSWFVFRLFPRIPASVQKYSYYFYFNEDSLLFLGTVFILGVDICLDSSVLDTIYPHSRKYSWKFFHAGLSILQSLEGKWGQILVSSASVDPFVLLLFFIYNMLRRETSSLTYLGLYLDS